MECRAGCGACCIAPAISSPIPGMPAGKLAGQRCVQLDAEYRCRLFNLPERPLVCLAFVAEEQFCGATRSEAIQRLTILEEQSRP